jgi:hypothetical protein
MAIVEKINRKGVDKVIHVLQQRTYENLLGFWVDGITFTMYPRANKNFKNDSTIPEISLDSKNYKETFYDDKVAVNSFFLVDDQSTYQNDNNQIVQDVSIIFQADLVKLYGDAERVDEVFNSDVLQVFKNVKRFIYSDIERITGFDSVYSDFSLNADLREKIQFSDISNRHILRLDFSIRYDFKCDSPIVPLCVPVTIMENGVLVALQAAGTTYSYSTACVDATVTVNGGAFDTVASGGTLDVEVEYETSLDNPIDSIVANKIIIVDPVVLPTNRIYLRPEPTGEIYVPASAFYLDGCDSWMIYNNIDPIVQTSSGIPMVIDKSKRWKLIPDNVFGHKFRFTGSTGGYYDPETLLFYDSDGTISTYASAFPSDYMIDNSTGLGWQTLGAISNFTFEGALANVASLSHAGFDDWFLPNLSQLMSVTDYGYNAPLGSTGDFNPIFTGGISNATKWTSTTIKGLETRVWIVQVIGAVPNNTLKTNITRYIAFRFHFS